MEPFLGQIMMFGGNFAPRSWAFCDGQLLPIAQYAALFSILGTTYGGDGRTTFALPDLRGRAPIHMGGGPGLSNYKLGQKGGLESVTLNITQIPSHSHTGKLQVSSKDSSQAVPTLGSSIATPGFVDGRAITHTYGFNNENPDIALNPGSLPIGNTGGNLSHENRQPYLAMNYIIALQGIFPSRN